MDARKCVQAITERLMWLLYPRFVHYCFTTPAYRMLGAQLTDARLPRRAATVLLSFTWLVAALLGPCFPILNALLAVLAKIYSVLLFGPDMILEMDMSPGYSEIVNSFGFRSVVRLVLVLQISNLLCHRSR
eukprot:5671427-Amphidinium_carterae.1